MARMNWQRARRHTAEPSHPGEDDRERLALPRKVRVRRERAHVETPEVQARIEATRETLERARRIEAIKAAVARREASSTPAR